MRDFFVFDVVKMVRFLLLKRCDSAHLAHLCAKLEQNSQETKKTRREKSMLFDYLSDGICLFALFTKIIRHLPIVHHLFCFG